jgi:uncharacterized RDD family membrane protein YckC
MFCTKCGANVPEGAGFCNACGTPVGGSAVARVTAPAGVVAPVAYVAAPIVPSFAPNVAYAGFWLRVVAYLIDGLLMGVVFGALILIAFLAFGGTAFVDSLKNANPDDVLPALFVSWFLLLIPIAIVLPWLYYAKMESSPRQGTFGKVALGLIVTDMAGRPITFGRASGRFFSKLITGMIPLGIGYIMAGFTEKKQALHDMIATCLVLRRL